MEPPSNFYLLVLNTSATAVVVERPTKKERGRLLLFVHEIFYKYVKPFGVSYASFKDNLYRTIDNRPLPGAKPDELRMGRRHAGLASTAPIASLASSKAILTTLIRMKALDHDLMVALKDLHTHGYRNLPRISPQHKDAEAAAATAAVVANTLLPVQLPTINLTKKELQLSYGLKAVAPRLWELDDMQEELADLM